MGSARWGPQGHTHSALPTPCTFPWCCLLYCLPLSVAQDKTCECTGKLAECASRRHPECTNPPRHECKPLPQGSAGFVDRARQFAAALVAKGRLLGRPVSSVRLTPFYDDCWERRGRCQGRRPCREPVDQAWARPRTWCTPTPCTSHAVLC